MKKISIELLNKILSYISRQPYVDVYQLIQELAALEDIEDKELAKK